MLRLPIWLTRPIYRVIFRNMEPEYYEGVGIVDFGNNENEFHELIIDSLELIKSTSPTDYYNIINHTDYIVNFDSIRNSYASYSIYGKHIQINAFQYWQDDAEYYSFCHIARTLVHEGAHARLGSRNVPYGENNWERVERLCERRANKFAKSIENPKEDIGALIKEFDPSWWIKNRKMSKFQQFKNIFRKLGNNQAHLTKG